MEWIARLNKAVDYLEENLITGIDPDEAARIFASSSYHFQTVFSYLANMPLSDYIRKRKMSLAVADLLSGEKVIEVALKYGYSSPTAFNRAFRSVHGMAPTDVKKKGMALKSFPALRFKITVTGVEGMNYRIEKKDAFRIVGVSAPLHREIEKNFKIVPEMWHKVAVDGTVQKLVDLAEGPPVGILGVSVCYDDEDWRYFIATASTKEVSEVFEEYTVGSFTWAVFPGEGEMPDAIQRLEKRIVSEWLPTSGYEYDKGPDIEVYLNPDPRNAEFEVWIPVVKRV